MIGLEEVSPGRRMREPVTITVYTACSWPYTVGAVPIDAAVAIAAKAMLQADVFWFSLNI